MIAFKTIRARAEKRKGGAEALARLMPPKPDPKALSKLRDDRALAEMTRRVFSAGFAWSVIEIEMARLRGSLSRLRAAAACIRARRVLAQTDHGRPHRPQRREDHVGARQRALRPGHREGARLVRQVPLDMAALRTRSGLLEVLAKRGSRLGGDSGQMLLRFLGYDAFVATKDVAACLRDAGLDIAEAPTSKRDLAKIQEQFNAWAKETGLPYRHISLICAMSIGENYEGDRYGGDVIAGQE